MLGEASELGRLHPGAPAALARLAVPNFPASRDAFGTKRTVRGTHLTTSGSRKVADKPVASGVPHQDGLGSFAAPLAPVGREAVDPVRQPLKDAHKAAMQLARRGADERDGHRGRPPLKLELRAKEHPHLWRLHPFILEVHHFPQTRRDALRLQTTIAAEQPALLRAEILAIANDPTGACVPQDIVPIGANDVIGGVAVDELALATLEETKAVALDVTGRRTDKRDDCLLYTSPSPRDRQKSRMPSSA